MTMLRVAATPINFVPDASFTEAVADLHQHDEHVGCSYFTSVRSSLTSQNCMMIDSGCEVP